MQDAVKLLDVVAVVRPLPDQNLVRGQVGTVVEELGPQAVEVEFIDDDGRTYALEALATSDVMVLRFRRQHAA